jgi:predicted dehydrogenase
VTRVRWGVLGVASIAVRKVIPAMQRSQRCEVVALASRDLVRAQEAAGRMGIRRAYGSYEDLLADPEVDAVYNPLPNHLHAEWTLRAAEAGKHVLCEKPLAMDEAEAVRIVEGCSRAGVKLMEAFMYRLHPQWVRARELVASGRLGELTAVQTFFSYRNVDPANIRNVSEYGGGALLDIGCYAINVARMMFGSEPDVVRAAIRRDPSFGTDVVATAVLGFGDGQAGFTVSTIIEPDQRVHVVGTEGRLLVEIPFNIPPDRPTRLLLTTGAGPPFAPNTEVIEVAPADQYTLQGDLFSEAVLSGGPVPLPPGDAVANMRVIDAVFAAAAQPGSAPSQLSGAPPYAK